MKKITALLIIVSFVFSGYQLAQEPSSSYSGDIINITDTDDIALSMDDILDSEPITINDSDLKDDSYIEKSPKISRGRAALGIAGLIVVGIIIASAGGGS
ncbi:MAG: hypothetical protein HN411_04930 [Waddliaceae bacterium]|jgi:hypothetical protein|nr:hypothetical protein [Waddliaceae bacterium]MBT3579073.1 hypothetical protein [Waddliaceae bacterium]MBT4444783.1 hypothetical protein [Waddliaceae bacterium]MBT6928052.1 hypothetical protein [Waddliaceae bacterium]MBT7264436.1 hypothetical protein [Waddliaceae bacterium]